jgi:hypothetical protein
MSFGRLGRSYARETKPQEDVVTTTKARVNKISTVVIPVAEQERATSTSKRETGIGLQTDDIDAYHADLRARGVDVDDEVSRMGDPVPPLFWLRDPEGNRLMVVQ